MGLFVEIDHFCSKSALCLVRFFKTQGGLPVGRHVSIGKGSACDGFKQIIGQLDDDYLLQDGWP